MNGLEEHLQDEINSSLVSIEALEEMSTATQKQLQGECNELTCPSIRSLQ